MHKLTAAADSMVFFLAAPTMVAGVIPWWITGWQVARPLPYGRLVQIAGGLLATLGAGVLVHAFARFVVEGRGTPAPVAPTQHLVVGGLYRHVRNPMYLAVLSAIVGQAMMLGRRSLVLYAAAVGLAFVTFVRGYEEPTLAATFGPEYDAYRSAVPGWWPRWRPWRPDPLARSNGEQRRQ